MQTSRHRKQDSRKQRDANNSNPRKRSRLGRPDQAHPYEVSLQQTGKPAKTEDVPYVQQTLPLPDHLPPDAETRQSQGHHDDCALAGGLGELSGADERGLRSQKSEIRVQSTQNKAKLIKPAIPDEKTQLLFLMSAL